MFNMSKSNPFASGQPFRDDPAPSGNEQNFHNGASSASPEATVAPAIVTAQAWGTEGESFIAVRTELSLDSLHCAALGSACLVPSPRTSG